MKEKEIYDKFITERNNGINTLNNEIKYDKLTFYFKSEDRILIKFNDFNRPLGLIRKIKDGSIDLEKAKENEEKFRSNLSETTGGKWLYKSEEQKSATNNLNKCFTKQRKKSSNCLMIMLQLYLRLSMK